MRMPTPSHSLLLRSWWVTYSHRTVLGLRGFISAYSWSHSRMPAMSSVETRTVRVTEGTCVSFVDCSCARLTGPRLRAPREVARACPAGPGGLAPPSRPEAHLRRGGVGRGLLPVRVARGKNRAAGARAACRPQLPANRFYSSPLKQRDSRSAVSRNARESLLVATAGELFPAAVDAMWKALRRLAQTGAKRMPTSGGCS